MKRIAIVSVALLALGACGDDDGEGDTDEPVDTAATDQSTDAPTSDPVELDLDEAGGACTLIDGDLLDQITGYDFRFASSGQAEDSEGEDPPDRATCAVQTAEAAYPDLTLFVIGTEAGVEVYEEELSGDAEPVEDLGEAGYWIVHTEDTGAGPALELGWYNDGEIFELRYTTPGDTDPQEVEDAVAGFEELARSIDAANAESED